VRCTRAAYDDGEDVYIGTWPVPADGICEGCGMSAKVREGSPRGSMVKLSGLSRSSHGEGR
jgi:hypothetical protein